MQDTDSNYRNGPDATVLFVRPGLFDRAFRLAADSAGPADSLYNRQDDVRVGTAPLNDPENFIGRDSRAFYLRINDPARNLDPTKTEELPSSAVSWFTLTSTLADDDNPANSGLTFVETADSSGIFLSRALMLVPDTLDVNQTTNTGVASHPGQAAVGQLNHRTRKVSAFDSLMSLQYQPPLTGSSPLKIRLPLFQRNPEERRVINFHAFSFSDTPKGVAAMPASTVQTQIQNLQERCLILGVKCSVQFNSTTDVIDLPAGSPVNLNNVGSFEQPGDFNTLTPSTDQLALISLVRAVDPASAANADTIYMLLVRNLSAGNRGESFPDGWIVSPSPSPSPSPRNFTFIAGMATKIDFTESHEAICHMLINQTLSEDEAKGKAAGWGGGGHFLGASGSADAINNLCYADTSSTPVKAPVWSVPALISDSLRIWDDLSHVVLQITRAHTATRYLKNP
jgi:hypothetical protein